MDELIARLRAVSETGCDPDLPHEAADAIQALVRRAEDAEQLAVARGHTIHGLRSELSAVKMEREDLAARLEVIPGGGPDGIECRDATIALQDARIAELEAKAERYKALLAESDQAEPVNARLLMAAKTVLDYTHVECRPPIRDEIECGRMTTVRVHALADLHEAVQDADAQRGKPARLTRKEINVLFLGWCHPSSRGSEVVKRVEAVVLRKQGYKVEG